VQSAIPCGGWQSRGDKAKYPRLTLCRKVTTLGDYHHIPPRTMENSVIAGKPCQTTICGTLWQCVAIGASHESVRQSVTSRSFTLFVVSLVDSPIWFLTRSRALSVSATKRIAGRDGPWARLDDSAIGGLSPLGNEFLKMELKTLKREALDERQYLERLLNLYFAFQEYVEALRPFVREILSGRKCLRLSKDSGSSMRNMTISSMSGMTANKRSTPALRPLRGTQSSCGTTNRVLS
jgi:hypothetical protein